MTTTVRQFDLFTGALETPQDLDLRQKVAFVLQEHPEAKEDDRLLTLWFWWTWDGLDSIMHPEQFDELRAWAVNKAEKPETIRRRRQELNQDGLHEPSPTEAAYRKKQSHKGSLGRRR